MTIRDKNPIFYFSGTGTCLDAARRIAEALPEFTPVPIAALAGEARVDVEAGAAGFVFPLYYTGLPRIVASFARRVSFSGPCSVFAVVACGRPRGYALHQLDALLRRSGASLSAGFYLPTQSNFLPYNEFNSDAEIATRVEAGERKLGEIVECLKSGGGTVEEEKSFLIHAVYPFFIHRLKRIDRFFKADDRCNSCGTCAAVCPAGNIGMKDGRPAWRGRCEFCLACINYCPRRALQWKNATQSKGRYHRAGVSAADIAGQKTH